MGLVAIDDRSDRSVSIPNVDYTIFEPQVISFLAEVNLAFAEFSAASFYYVDDAIASVCHVQVLGRRDEQHALQPSRGLLSERPDDLQALHLT